MGRSDDPLHHEWMILPLSYISLPKKLPWSQHHVAMTCTFARQVPNRTFMRCHGLSSLTTSTPFSQPPRTISALHIPREWLHIPCDLIGWLTSSVYWGKGWSCTLLIWFVIELEWFSLCFTYCPLDRYLYSTSLWPNLMLLSDAVWLSFLVLCWYIHLFNTFYSMHISFVVYQLELFKTMVKFLLAFSIHHLTGCWI